MPAIESNADLPELINHEAKQKAWAKRLVTKCLSCAPKAEVGQPPIQGFFSRTLFLTLTDGREVAVQFRTEPLGLESFQEARRVLGSCVPEVQHLADEELEKAGVWAYYATRMPGQIWLRAVAGKGIEGLVTVNKSLGRVFSNGFMASNSHEAVESTIRPHLDAILASPLEEILPFRERLEDYSKRLDEFAQLPLWIAHYDINEVNVLLDDKCEVTGLIDWEYSTPLPFGVGFGRVHTYAGHYSEGEFYFQDEFEAAERGFWQELFDGMSEEVRRSLQERIHLVQDAVLLGTLLDCFYYDIPEGKVGFGEVSLRALPKLLTYRIPFVRGDDKPYRG
ncbi:hypothetical protein F5Y17DRAFT_156706 [Xylariaceae sp. FL0594]|nr:hypothetical protein F5Y17DRAFT_156706 [Xylariaceae sp. FL0594]